MAMFWIALLSAEAVLTVLAVLKSAESESGGSDGGAS